MSTTHVVHHHESHGNHHVSVVGYFLIIAGFANAALWLVNLASGNTGPAVIFGIIAGCTLVAAAVIMTTMSRRLHHSPFVPDNTDVETGRYLHEYRD